jgi:heme exporter protein A
MTDDLIKLEKVTKKYSHIEALKELSFSLKKGEFLSIFGANGAGKSTLLKILSAQTKATKGSIFFNGTNIKDLPNDFRQNFGIISHQPFLYENLSAFENLNFYAKLYSVENIEEVVKNILKKVELFKRKDDLVRGYSRGMLQRLSIARALIHNPEIILLDEPYTGLDQHASYLLSNILQEQFENNKTIIMVTHNLQRGYQLSSKIAIMKKGEFVFFDDKEKILEEKLEETYLKLVS